QCRAPRAGGGRGGGRVDGASPVGGQSRGADGAVVGLPKVSGIGPSEADTRNGQRCTAGVRERHRLSRAGDAYALVAEVWYWGRREARQTGARARHARSLRAVAGTVGHRQRGGPRSDRRWGERDVNRAARPRRQARAAVIRLRKVAAVGPREG